MSRKSRKNEAFDLPSFQMIRAASNGDIEAINGVKGEGHNNVCFIAEDSTRNPIVYMYEFFQLLCAEDINLTDFQNFYYDYVSEIKSINLTYLKPAKSRLFLLMLRVGGFFAFSGTVYIATLTKWLNLYERRTHLCQIAK
ncbi:hypothetical protein NE590_09175 [Blautia obeum]|uniref:hypothetical protein n=1 Tax=Blautia obeum TaxID=40520 RepID=UPI00210C255B|nr:hypothetical protein [Blautia obeum]MCQ4790013.1 hypothetical protein [Blautia obeum]